MLTEKRARRKALLEGPSGGAPQLLLRRMMFTNIQIVDERTEFRCPHMDSDSEKWRLAPAAIPFSSLPVSAT